MSLRLTVRLRGQRASTQVDARLKARRVQL